MATAPGTVPRPTSRRDARIDRLDRLRALAAGQDAQFAWGQAVGLAISRATVRALHERGEIAAVRRGVWRFCGVPGEADPAVAAYLACWPHAVVSHASAARHHRLTRVPAPTQPVVTVEMGTRLRPDGVIVHRTRSLPPRDVVTVGNVRYTSLARTTCDLADPTDEWGTLGILDDAVARGAPPRWINQVATALARGRPGVALLRRATAPEAAAAFRSWLERAASHVYRAASIPDPEWNVPVSDPAGRIGVVDALWRPWHVVAEKEGLRFHTSPQQRRDDARRFNRLLEAGYEPRRFTWEDVVHRPVEVVVTVMRALRAAGADLDPARIPRSIAVPRRPFR